MGQGWGGVGWGGERSSTGHQLLSDYIIPDIKTTHTDQVPAGGPRKEGEGGVWASLAPQPIPILTPRPLAARKWAPILALPQGRTPQRCPPAHPREDSERGQLPSSPAGRPGGGGGRETAARGPAAEAAQRGGAGGRRLRSITMALPRRIPGRLPARRSGSGAHSHGLLPALLRRSRGGSGGSSAGPGAGGPSRAPRGRRLVSPARRPDPSLARTAAAGRCGAGGGFVCARRALGALAEARRARTEEHARLGGPPASAFAAGRRAGLGGLRSRRPLLLSRGSPLPADSAPDRWRNCNNAPPPPRLLAATHADAPAPPAPAPSEDGAGRTLRVAGPTALSTHPSGAASGDHWCLGRGRG